MSLWHNLSFSFCIKSRLSNGVRMKTIFVAFFCLSFPLFAQDHAPTVEQCRADQRLWAARMEDNTNIGSLSAKELNTFSGEMNDCVAVDSERENAYNLQAAMFRLEIEKRLTDFLVRHDLMQQFAAEDKAGKR